MAAQAEPVMTPSLPARIAAIATADMAATTIATRPTTTPNIPFDGCRVLPPLALAPRLVPLPAGLGRDFLRVVVLASPLLSPRGKPPHRGDVGPSGGGCRCHCHI